MAKSLEFGRSVLVMDADDSKLEAALKADEQLVTQSVNKMQGNLNKLEVSMTGTGSAAGVATTGVSALGAAAAATGNTSLMVAAQAGTLGVALRTMGNEALGASAQLRVLAASSLKFIATPLGATLAVIAVILGAVALAWKKAGDEAEKAREKMEKERGKQLQDYEAGVKVQGELVAIQDKILVAQGKLTQRLADENALRLRLTEVAARWPAFAEERVRLQNELTDALEQNAAAAKLAAAADADAKAVQAREDKLNALRDELAILTSSLTKYDLIADAEERSLQIQIDQTREMQQQAKLAEDRARAERERFEGKGPKTAAEAETLVRQSIQLAEANQRSGALVRDAVEKLKLLGIDSKMLEKVAQSLGADAVPTTTRFGQGALELSAFAATGRGGGGVAGPDPVQAARIAKEDKRTKGVEDISKSVDRLLTAMSRWNPGAS